MRSTDLNLVKRPKSPIRRVDHQITLTKVNLLGVPIRLSISRDTPRIGRAPPINTGLSINADRFQRLTSRVRLTPFCSPEICRAFELNDSSAFYHRAVISCWWLLALIETVNMRNDLAPDSWTTSLNLTAR